MAAKTGAERQKALRERQKKKLLEAVAAAAASMPDVAPTRDEMIRIVARIARAAERFPMTWKEAIAAARVVLEALSVRAPDQPAEQTSPELADAIVAHDPAIMAAALKRAQMNGHAPEHTQ